MPTLSNFKTQEDISDPYSPGLAKNSLLEVYPYVVQNMQIKICTGMVSRVCKLKYSSLAELTPSCQNAHLHQLCKRQQEQLYYMCPKVIKELKQKYTEFQKNIFSNRRNKLSHT
jgi:hypothetical protein